MGVCAARAPPPPSEPGTLVELSLTRSAPRAALGLSLGRDHKGIVVYGVEENSVMWRWNEAHPKTEVARHDRVRSVNGIVAGRTVEGLAKILEECRKMTVTLVIFRYSKRQPSLDSLLSVFADEKAHGECPICLDEVQEGEGGLTMPCGHCFHQSCVKKWLTKNPANRSQPKCPMCRKPIPLEDNVSAPVDLTK